MKILGRREQDLRLEVTGVQLSESKLIPNQVVLCVYIQISLSQVCKNERNQDLQMLAGKKNLAHEVMSQNKEIGYGEALGKGQVMSINIA